MRAATAQSRQPRWEREHPVWLSRGSNRATTAVRFVGEMGNPMAVSQPSSLTFSLIALCPVRRLRVGTKGRLNSAK